MIEADDQLVVNEFLDGWVSDDKLKTTANLWPNHFTDYHPLLELARDHELRFIATSVQGATPLSFTKRTQGP